MPTKIEWCDETWNAVAGCSDVGPGCEHCYAKSVSHMRVGNPAIGHMFAGLTKQTDHGPQWTGAINVREHRISLPLKWREPRRIFVTSLGDLWHENVPDEIVARHLNVARHSPQHIYLDLTKRPAARRVWFEVREEPPPNWMSGLSVSCQDDLDKHGPDLVLTPGGYTHWLSYEPALGPLNLDADSWFLRGVSWVVAGGESGPNARPAHPDWFRTVRDQCDDACVPFFMKQWGEWAPLNNVRGTDLSLSIRKNSAAWGYWNDEYPGGERFSANGVTSSAYRQMVRVGKKAAGHLLDGVEHFAYLPAAMKPSEASP